MTSNDRACTAAEIRALERPLLEAGVPLMQRASQALARHVQQRLAARVTSVSLTPDDDGAEPAASGAAPASGPRIALLVGGGDNGGDALFAGAILARDGAVVDLVPTSDRMHAGGAAAAREAGARVVDDADASADELAIEVATADAIVDGVLGIGAGGTAAGGSPALRGRARELVAATRLAVSLLPDGERPLVVAVDVPSGIDPDSGEVAEPEAVLSADVTVTFIRVKTGLTLEPAASFAGEVVLDDLGVDDLGVD